MTWLKILGITAALGVIVLLIVLSDRHRRLHPPAPRKHRAGQRRDDDAPIGLPPRLRQHYAPTAYEQVALSVGPGEETCALAAPYLDDDRSEVSDAR